MRACLGMFMRSSGVVVDIWWINMRFETHSRTNKSSDMRACLGVFMRGSGVVIGIWWTNWTNMRFETNSRTNKSSDMRACLGMFMRSGEVVIDSIMRLTIALQPACTPSNNPDSTLRLGFA